MTDAQHLKTLEQRGSVIYVMRYSPEHRWYYFPRMQPSDALLLKTYDSETDGRARFMGHSALEDANTPAGAGKRERDERTYVKGAYDRGGDDESSSSQPKFLRPKGNHYSVILATFGSEGTGKQFTLAQVLYLTADQSVERRGKRRRKRVGLID